LFSQWAPNLVDLLMEANQLSTENTLKVLLRNRYHRVDAQLPVPVHLDDVACLNKLIEAADAMDLGDAEEFLVTTFFSNINT
jgi:hypothetical protein